MNYKDKFLYSVQSQQFPQDSYPHNQYHNQYQKFQPKYNQAITKQELSLKPNGIKNIGNNCYMNSVIQALYSIKIFRKEILNLVVNQQQQPKCITAYFVQLFKQLSSTFNSPLDPTDFYVEFLKQNTNFQFGRQEDANEFLLTLFQQFGNDMKRQELESNNSGFLDWFLNIFTDKPKLNDFEKFWHSQREKENNLITQTFVGVTKNTITCNDCRFIQQNYEEFTTINLSFPQTLNKRGIQIQYIDSVTLLSLLVSQFNKQLINQYQCPKCNSKSNCQELSIAKYPEIIIFSLKRFLFKNEFETQRINTAIIFPIEKLELQQYCSEKGKNVIYRLQSIIHHLGTCEHGHYYSTCRYDNDNWYRFDDSIVDKVNISIKQYDTFGTPTPYMLIYQIQQ